MCELCDEDRAARRRLQDMDTPSYPATPLPQGEFLPEEPEVVCPKCGSYDDWHASHCPDSRLNQRASLPDSGTREHMSTGSQRDSREGKGRFDLLPPDAIMRIAQHFEAGAKKYDDRNWEKGQPIGRLMDSGLRHVIKYLRGDRDEDHLAAAGWNILCAMQMEAWIERGEQDYLLADLPWQKAFWGAAMREDTDSATVEEAQRKASNA